MDTPAAVMITPLNITDLLLLGCLGGFFVEALKHVRKMQGKQLPDAFELAVSLILIIVGGGVTAVYSGQVQSMLLAVQVGATAPAIIGAWASGGPPSPGGGGPTAVGSGGGTGAILKADVASRVLHALTWSSK